MEDCILIDTANDVTGRLFKGNIIACDKAQNTDLEKIWLSTFSPRVSAAGYVASLFPFLSPDRLRHSMSKPLLILYLALQFAFFPIAYIESLFGYGSAIRAIYRKKRRIQ